MDCVECCRSLRILFRVVCSCGVFYVLLDILWIALCVVGSCVPVECLMCCVVGYPVDCVMCCRFLWIVFCVVNSCGLCCVVCYPVDCVTCCTLSCGLSFVL